MKRAAIALAVAVLVAWWLWPRARAPSPSQLSSPSPSQSQSQSQSGSQSRPTLTAAPRNTRSAAAANPHAADAGAVAAPSDPSLFGKAVELHNSFAIAEALSKNAAAADAHVDELCEQSRRVKPREQPSNGGDAAQFMAPLMDYEAPLNDPPGKLHLPDALRERIRSYGDAWRTRINEGDLAGLDFGWMAQLAQFDHWTVLTAGRLRDYKPGNVFYFPIPNYSSLMTWARLRYARGDANAAVEVHHLADLIRSQQLLISEMVANVIDKYDPQADAADLDLRRKVAFASIYFGYPGVSAETVRKAMACAPAPCSALIEAASANRSFASYAATDNLALVRQLAADHGCETALFDRIADARELPAGEAVESSVDDLAGAIGKWLDEKK